MKWFGAIILIAISTIIGFEFSRRLSNRPNHINQVKNALLILEAEIVYSQAKLQEAFKVVASQIPKPTEQLFLNTYQLLEKNEMNLIDIWKESVTTFMQKSSLTKTEEEILIQFGKTLGQYDISQQQKYISVTIHHLDRLLREAELIRDKYGKMAKSLGVLTGIFVVLLLI